MISLVKNNPLMDIDAVDTAKKEIGFFFPEFELDKWEERHLQRSGSDNNDTNK